MPTRKLNGKSTETTTVLKRRISDLSDRIAVLENNLTRTQERIQSDMKLIFEKLGAK
jgi:chaperonin cofactor prefoldin